MIGLPAQHGVLNREPQTGTTTFTDIRSTNFHFRSSRRGKNFYWCLKIRSLEELLKGRKRNRTGKVTYYDTRNVEYRESSFVNGNIFWDDSKGSACIRETGNSKAIENSKERHCQSRAFNFLMSNNNFHSNSISSELLKNQANKQNMHT
jgi:hypothetical protein